MRRAIWGTRYEQSPISALFAATHVLHPMLRAGIPARRHVMAWLQAIAAGFEPLRAGGRSRHATLSLSPSSLRQLLWGRHQAVALPYARYLRAEGARQDMGTTVAQLAPHTRIPRQDRVHTCTATKGRSNWRRQLEDRQTALNQPSSSRFHTTEEARGSPSSALKTAATCLHGMPISTGRWHVQLMTASRPGDARRSLTAWDENKDTATVADTSPGPPCDKLTNCLAIRAPAAKGSCAILTASGVRCLTVAPAVAGPLMRCSTAERLRVRVDRYENACWIH